MRQIVVCFHSNVARFFGLSFSSFFSFFSLFPSPARQFWAIGLHSSCIVSAGSLLPFVNWWSFRFVALVSSSLASPLLALFSPHILGTAMTVDVRCLDRTRSAPVQDVGFSSINRFSPLCIRSLFCFPLSYCRYRHGENPSRSSNPPCTAVLLITLVRSPPPSAIT